MQTQVFVLRPALSISTMGYITVWSFMPDVEEQTRRLICFCVLQYGYRLPELAEDEVLYCSVYFRLLGEILFRYQTLALNHI